MKHAHRIASAGMAALLLFAGFGTAAKAGAADARSADNDTLEQSLSQEVAAAKPGDEIVVPNGIYRDFQVTLEGHGAEGEPIVIRAESPGGVQFTGKSAITLRGDHLEFRDFYFNQAHPDRSHYVLGLSGLADSRVSGNFFDHSGPWNPNDGVIRIQDKSRNNRIDHNTLWASVSMGIAVRVNSDNNLENVHNAIDHNVFKDVPPVKQLYPDSNGNGLESVQIGQGFGYEETPVYTTVEANVFENVTGDASEIISNKTAYNIIRYNTFKDCHSGVTLRFGGHVVVDRNFFLNMDYGLRVTDVDQQVTNNYMYNVGEGIRIYAGRKDSNAAEGRQISYRPVKNALISGNTILYSAANGIDVGDSYNSNPPSNLTYYPPEDVTIQGNVIVTDRGEAINETVGSNIQYRDNHILVTGDARVGEVPDSGWNKSHTIMMYDSNSLMYLQAGAKTPEIRPMTIAEAGPDNKYWLGIIEAAGQGQSPAVDPASIDAKTVRPVTNKDQGQTGQGFAELMMLPHALVGRDFVSLEVRAASGSLPVWDRLTVTLPEKKGAEEWSAQIGSVNGEWQQIVLPLAALRQSAYARGNGMLDADDIRSLKLSTLSGAEIQWRKVTAGQFLLQSVSLSKPFIRLAVGGQYDLSRLAATAEYANGYTGSIPASDIQWSTADDGLLQIRNGILTAAGQPGTSAITATYRGIPVQIPVQIVVVTIVGVTASAEPQPENSAANTIDGDLSTRWSAEGDQWIQYELRDLLTIRTVQIAWYSGDKRSTTFEIEVSQDGNTWQQVYAGQSSGTTSDFEAYSFPATPAKYVRIVAHGNSSSDWDSISEVAIPQA